MTEQEFRSFLGKRPHLMNRIEKLIEATSPASLRQKAIKSGWSMTEEQSIATASLLRTQSATLLSMTETGSMTEGEALDFRIKKLPDDFPR